MKAFAAFNISYRDAVDMIPSNDNEAKAKFIAALIAFLSQHIEPEVGVHCINRALDEALGFNQPRLQLVKGGKQ